MSAPFEICSKPKRLSPVLASGVVISLTALTGGIAPAFRQAGHRSGRHPRRPPAFGAEGAGSRRDRSPATNRQPPKAQAPLPVAPSVESPTADSAGGLNRLLHLSHSRQFAPAVTPVHSRRACDADQQ